jgi:hypothetical protein
MQLAIRNLGNSTTDILNTSITRLSAGFRVRVQDTSNPTTFNDAPFPLKTLTLLKTTPANTIKLNRLNTGTGTRTLLVNRRDILQSQHPTLANMNNDVDVADTKLNEMRDILTTMKNYVITQNTGYYVQYSLLQNIINNTRRISNNSINLFNSTFNIKILTTIASTPIAVYTEFDFSNLNIPDILDLAPDAITNYISIIDAHIANITLRIAQNSKNKSYIETRIALNDKMISELNNEIDSMIEKYANGEPKPNNIPVEEVGVRTMVKKLTPQVVAEKVLNMRNRVLIR